MSQVHESVPHSEWITARSEIEALRGGVRAVAQGMFNAAD